MLTINIEVRKVGSESNLGLLRRFSKAVQGARIVNRVRANRYQERAPSPFKRKQSALNLLKRRAEWERLSKLGKTPQRKK